MTETEKYLFDVHGYLVIKGALSPEEVAAANAAIDHHAEEIFIMPNELAHGSTTLIGTTGRGNLSDMLTWEKPHCDVFRHIMAHPNFTPYLYELLGPGFRFEGMGLITMDAGAEGFWFHEGGTPYDRSRNYHHHNGRIYSGMTNMAVQLADVGPGEGGFACFPGSHKANFPCPGEIRLYENHQERFAQVSAKAGDVILFVEALMHGTLPWTGKHQRRSLRCVYNPGVVGEGLMGEHIPPAFYAELTEAQKAVISAPRYRDEVDKGQEVREYNAARGRSN